MKLIIAMTGATGSIYTYRLLMHLRRLGHHATLICSPWGVKTFEYEMALGIETLSELANVQYEYAELSAPCASGSFAADAAIVMPCSMKTLAGVAHGYADNLIVRVADVFLKERRPLILSPRETPLSLIHIENMRAVTLAGAILVPPAPAFYHRPQSIEDVVDQTVGKIFDLLKIEHQLFQRWEGFPDAK